MSGSAKLTSRDGTVLGYERTGTGPALVVVDAAGNYSGFRALPAPVELLANHFTVYVYDRRGRGGSGDTPPYAVEREVEDLAAVISAAGGSAFVYGMSSGALLALHAAASGLPIPRLALFEAPIVPTEAPSGPSEFTLALDKLVRAGQRREAVEYFHRGIGVPDEIVDEMAPEVRAALEAVAHTLVYDCTLSDTMSLPLVSSVTAPTLVLDSQGSSENLTDMSGTLVGALPNGTRRSLSGEWHGVPAETLAPVLVEFFTG